MREMLLLLLPNAHGARACVSACAVVVVVAVVAVVVVIVVVVVVVAGLNGSETFVAALADIVKGHLDRRENFSPQCVILFTRME